MTFLERLKAEVNAIVTGDVTELMDQVKDDDKTVFIDNEQLVKVLW